MTNSDRCFIQKLVLRNYRAFPELVVEFHESLTVLVAPNGGGKTAVLDGLAIALRLFVDTAEGRSNSKGFGAGDIRLVLNPAGKMEPVTPARLDAMGTFLGQEITWAQQRQSVKASRSTTAEAQDLILLAARQAKENQEWAQGKTPLPPLFPLIASYGTGRLWSPGRLTEGKKVREGVPNARYRGYTDCLAATSHYRYFIDWFRRFSYEAKQENGNSRESQHKPEEPLGAIRQAVDIALKPSGWHTLEWDFAEDVVRANHDRYGPLPVDYLSDGIRNMIGLVADIAHRAVRLNPHLGRNAALETPGIVLIDEVDMHLHPEWQQVVLPSIQQAFPLMQFIVTTHSPQVLSTVPAECILMLLQDADGNWVAMRPGEQTKGIESAHVMAAVMDTDPIPPVEEARWLSDYQALIQEHLGDSKAAQGLRAKLEGHFGSGHPVILECDRLIRLERFKKTLPAMAKKGKGDDASA
jgi:predicted ATP-binding protein involved in virulence